MKTNAQVSCLILLFFTCFFCDDAHIFAATDDQPPASTDKPTDAPLEIDLAKRDLESLEQKHAELEKVATKILAYDELNQKIRLYEGLRNRPNIAKVYDELVEKRAALGVSYTDDQIANAKVPLKELEKQIRDVKVRIRRLELVEKRKNAPKPKTNPVTPGKSDPVPTTPTLNIDTSKPWIPARQNVEAAINAAPKRPVEDLLEPVHTVRYDGDKNLIWAPNPDGKTWDVLPIYFSDYGGKSTVPIIDLGSGELKVNNYPRGLGWHLAPDVLAPNGKVYISMVNRGHVSIAIYDPAKNELNLDAIPVPEHVRGETHPLIRSTDGMIFAGGGHSDQSVACIMIDPKTGAVTDFGACGPRHSPHNAYNYYMGADDTHVYIASGKVPWYLLAVDRKTKQTTTLAKTNTSGGLVQVNQDVHGVIAYVRTGDGSKPQLYWCHKGKLVPKSNPCPWGKTGTDWEKALPPKPEIYTERIVPEQGQQAEFWAKQTIRGVTPDPKYRGWSRFSYDVPLYALGSDRLIEMPDGRIFGTAGSYAGHYIFDPKTGKSMYMGKTGLSHYATVIHDNKIWLSGYPSSKLYMFDCAKPWNVRTQGDGPGKALPPPEAPGNNPRLLGRLGESGCHKMYGAAAGASGHLYFGGRWMRTGNNGGFGWWDPKTNKEAGIWKPFSAHQITFLCAAGEGKYIVISTLGIKDTILKTPTPKEGKLFIFDDAKKQIVREITVVEGVRGPGPIVWAGGNRVMGWTNDPSDDQKSILYGADVEKGEVAWKMSLPYKLPVVIGSNQEEGWDFRLGPDGRLWTFMGKDGKTLVRIDPRTAKIEPVAVVTRGGRLAFSSSDIYLSGTTHIRRIRGVVPR